MNKRVIAALATVVLGIVSVGLLIGYAKNADERAFNDAKLQSVLQVKESIPANTEAEALGDRVEAVRLPRSAIAKGAISDLSAVKGLSTTTKLEPGEQLLASRFEKGGPTVGSVRSKNVPKGYQEITVPLSAARAVGGEIKVGDTVGIVSSLLIGGGDGTTQVIVNKAKITGIARAVVAEEGSDASGDFLITLAVTTRQAGEIVNTAEYGKLWLTKQYPDTEGGGGGIVSKVELGSGE